MLNLNFIIFPELFTERLVLRELNADDAQQVHLLRSNEEVNQFIDRIPSSGIEDALAHINKIDEYVKNKQSVNWAIALKGNPELIGGICFWNFDEANSTIELGYELLPEYHHKGIMTEAIHAAIQFGFEQIKAETITAFPSANNIKSVGILEKIGFKLDDGLYANTHDGIDDMLTYILKPDMLVSKGK
ncbi:GNAT family N-acetyltransferase [Mucilaginibacter paludis]|uniref:GCN5-related N-acetyltransferase n=1 Tax=Mucilaginibacter paludis DSM 18603 TaxID=714943 RepID=H1YDI3_9SPHI|nr:GNAT family N-acetyltransferase [Mucilaginibacter paludis]EHQ30192.1 GCN5-related N-acetyltransferase [Mucilaginibacter paludis DSM 18603]